MARMLRRGRREAFYRSAVARWATAAAGTYLSITFAFGPPQWRNTPSLRWLHQFLPWPVVSILFAVYAVLLFVGRSLPVAVGCSVGMILYGWEFLALLWTTDPGRPQNPVAIGCVFLTCVLHYQAARLAIIQRETDRADHTEPA